jgi:hypothetical protein
MGKLALRVYEEYFSNLMIEHIPYVLNNIALCLQRKVPNCVPRISVKVHGFATYSLVVDIIKMHTMIKVDSKIS